MNCLAHLARRSGCAFLLAFIAALSMSAIAAGDRGGHQKSATAAPAADDMTDGEVRKVDKDAAKITLKHADIKSLDMPAMTMVFAVKDKAMLDVVKAGDKVKFKAVNEAGKFTVTEIQLVK